MGEREDLSVDDYLSEAEQWERVKAWVRQNGLWIVGGVALGVIALVGWRWWGSHQNTAAVQAAEKYQAVITAFEKGDRTLGLATIEELKRDYKSSPYADQADLLAARVFVEGGELDKAAARLKGVMDSTKDGELAKVARLRLGRVQVAQGKPDDALSTLAVANAGAFAPRYHEARGDAYYAKGDKANALKEYESARKGGDFDVVDAQLLDLKIKDLSGGSAGASEPATASAVEAK
jgi:predicted negative regulator of RcsB-dependent stress response